MRVQSLLFGRSAGWDASKAKAWAKSHGYKHGKVDVTDQYVRIRQFDPKDLKVKRTITLGRGIRAVVAREEDMAAKRRKKKSAPRHRRASATTTTKRRRKRTVRETTRRHRRRLPGGTMMEAKRRKRRKRHSARESWFGNPTGHRKAAKKGHRRRKARRKTGTREYTYEARKPRRRRKARRARETGVMTEARRSRKRRSSKRRRSYSTHEARRTRRHSMFAANRGGSGMTGGQFAVALVAGGVGFVVADAVDRLLATYNPDPAKADPNGPPKDKFTSNGAGTMANVLNVGATPNVMRIGAGVGLTALPAIGSMFVKNPILRSSLEGLAIGSGVKLISMFWNNVVMGHLLAPKDQSVAGLQKSVIARLYPAEVAATMNMKQAPPVQQLVSTGGSGALSDAPAQQTAGVGAPADVGPFALAGSSDYPDAAQALRQQAGVHDQFPSMQNVWGTGENYPTAAQVMRQPNPNLVHPQGTRPMAHTLHDDATAYQPGPPPGPGPGPQATPHKDEGCGCIGEADNLFLGFIGDEDKDTVYNGSGKAA